MSASRRRPTPRFQPGIAAMYACTGASPSALAICGLPPLRSRGFAVAAGALRRAAVVRVPLLAALGRVAAGFPLMARDERRVALGLALLGMRSSWIRHIRGPWGVRQG